MFERVRGFLLKAGRDPARFGMEVRMQLKSGDTLDMWRRGLEAWRTLAPTHVVAVTQIGGFGSMDERVEALGRFAALARE